MTNLRGLTMGVVAGGLMSLGNMGIAVAQTDAVPRPQIDAVAQELQLSDETRRELAPLLERLNGVFEHQQKHWREGDEIWEELAVTYDQIAETLSATELSEFYWLMQETGVDPWFDRPMRGYTMGGRGRMGGAMYGGPGTGWGRGPCGRGMYMRGMRGYAGQRTPMRGYAGRGTRPGWRPNDINPNN